jgi:hypothetical protein
MNMRNSIWGGIMMTVALAAGAPLANAGDVSVGVTITGEIVPGVYGRVDLANRPAPPPLVYAKPVYIERAPPNVVVQPVYLHVPPGHAKNWRKHCHEYHACNQPVYFVRSAEYEPGYQPGKHDDDDGDHHGHGHGHDRH